MWLESGASLAKLLGHGGTLVTYGGMSKQPVSVPVGPFIFKDIALRGFWMTRWSQQHSVKEREALFEALADHWERGELSHASTLFKFEAEWREALGHASAPFRTIKAVLDMRTNQQ